MIKNIKPPKLKVGDVIGFYSPSSPATYYAPKRFQRAKTFLQSKGFRLKEGSLTGKSAGYRSGTIQERAAELNALIRDPEVRCIMSTIGGWNSNSLLPYIDYEALRNDPKIFIGYSDVTAVLLSIYTQTGIIPFYGPALVASFGELDPLLGMTYQTFAELLVEDGSAPYQYAKPPFWTEERIDWEEQDRAKVVNENEWITIGEGKAQGRVIGGNLNTIRGFWGSPYMPAIEEGDILFIEDSLQDAGAVERFFAFLKINGVFDKLAGILLGKHELFNDHGTGVKHYEILLEVLAGQDLPILAEFDCAHTHPMFTLPLGVQIEMDTIAQTVTILENWVS